MGYKISQSLHGLHLLIRTGYIYSVYLAISGGDLR